MLGVLLVLQTENKSFLASLEELISSLDGVYSSKVVLSKDQVPEEIHLLASDKKSPKTITRDVQSALMAVFGVNIDYRIISIAQVPPKMSQKEIRLDYTGIETKFINGNGEVSVFLSCGDKRMEGKSFYIGRQQYAMIRAVALATLESIYQHLIDSSRPHFELISVETTEAAGRPVVLLVISDEKGQEYLGIAFIKENTEDSVVRAVLNALNRRISTFIAI